jgi:hypothetical protein
MRKSAHNALTAMARHSSGMPFTHGGAGGDLRGGIPVIASRIGANSVQAKKEKGSTSL